MKTGIVYDAAAVSRILGLLCECNSPGPEALDGEIVIYYGGWSLPQLRLSEAGKQRMWQDQHWYEEYKWKADSGYYRLLLPVPNSNGLNWSEQLRHLATIEATWQPASVCVATTAVLAHLTETGSDLLSDWCRCLEALPDERRVGLDVDGGRVHVDYYWDGRRSDDVWGSAARKS